MNLQNWYRKQGSVGIVGLILITFSMIVLASCGNKPFMLGVSGQQKNSGNEPSPVVVQKQRGGSGRTFADWCRDKASLSPEVKYTVEELLKVARTTECDAANQKLSTLTELYLYENSISDIKPLESLTNLTRILLYKNQISNIKPLESLTNLTFVNLDNNQISDLKPLQSLTNLTSLNFFNNKISDIKPLKSLTNLTQLYLSGNQLAPKTCPLKPQSICKWEPRN